MMVMKKKHPAKKERRNARKAPGAKRQEQELRGSQSIIAENITSGTVLSIDPGSDYLGWTISKVSDDDGQPKLEGYGTIYGEGKGTARFVYIINEIKKLIDTYNPEILAIEDYIYIPGRSKGMFIVPAIIGLIKYTWFLHTGKEAIMITAATWKTLICGKGNASKDEVRENMFRFLSPEIVENIKTTYAKIRGDMITDWGEQDCIDSMALGLYMCCLIGRNRAIKEMQLKFS